MTQNPTINSPLKVKDGQKYSKSPTKLYQRKKTKKENDRAYKLGHLKIDNEFEKEKKVHWSIK